MSDAVPSKAPSVLTDAAHLFALCGLAIAQPLFDLLGKNPTFFVAHDLDGADVVVLAVAILLIPPVALFAILSATRLAPPLVGRVVRAVLAGLLIAMTLVPPIERAVGMSTTGWIVTMVLVAFGAAAAYDQWRHLRLFLTYLSPAPVLFLVIFLLFTPVHTLVFGADPAAAAVDLQGTRTPIVVLVLDEAPLGVLLDEEGAIDGRAFPNFARLAEVSTWYPNTTTVSTQTLRAVPAIMTGNRQAADFVPIAAEAPRSLFTLVARSHEMNVTEPVTKICPKNLCRDRTRKSTGPDAQVGADVRTVFLHTLLPEPTTRDWGIPSIGDRWSGFDTEATTRTRSNADKSEDSEVVNRSDFEARALERIDSTAQSAVLNDFIESLERDTRTGLWFAHVMLPHVPYALVPDGRAYNAAYVPRQAFDNTIDPDLLHVDAQRLVLQTMAVDTMIGRFLDQLEQSTLLSDAMVVVVSDHGMTLAPRRSRRDVSTTVSRDGVLPVPLFIRYPGQTKGMVDTRSARTIDVLPTIADALGIDLPRGWKFDGRSLLGSARKEARLLVDDKEITEPVDAQRFADDLATYLVRTGDVHDPYRLGPHGDLVGQAVNDLDIGTANGFASIDDAATYEQVDLGRTLPLELQATIDGVNENEWLAVAVNGTIAGVGPTYLFESRVRLVAMIDPSLLRSGANVVDLYSIDSAGTLHRLNQ